jgi:hypothetical protein
MPIPARPKTEPGKGDPLRQWAAPSYDPDTGRAAASSMEPQRSYNFDGEHCHPNAQAPRGQHPGNTPSFEELDRSRTTNPTPVRKRPLG